MKKILAFVLALCLTLSLSVAAFADASITLPVDPNGGVNTNSSAVSKNVYSAVDANGAPVAIKAAFVTEGAEYDEAAAYGIIAVYAIDVLSNVTGTITLDLYAPGATSDCKVLVYDAWEELGSLVSVSGDRVKVAVDADLLRQYKYIAIVKNFDAVDVNTPSEGIDGDEDDMNVEDNEPAAPSTSENPKTGIALAVVPMMVAAAAAVVSKRR